jgi:hypothetical protein
LIFSVCCRGIIFCGAVFCYMKYRKNISKINRKTRRWTRHIISGVFYGSYTVNIFDFCRQLSSQETGVVE